MIENARELLLQPGQFYHDRTAGRLLYLPRPEEQGRAASLTAYVPGLVTLARVDGAAGAMVTNLTLAHAAVDFSGFFAGDGDGQAATNLQSAAVEVVRTTSFALTNVEVAHVGGFGLLINSSSSGVRVERCNLHDVGAGGLRVGAVADAPPVFDVNVTDTLVHDGGHVHTMGPGISDGGRLVAYTAAESMFTTIGCVQYPPFFALHLPLAPCLLHTPRAFALVVQPSMEHGTFYLGLK